MAAVLMNAPAPQLVPREYEPLKDVYPNALGDRPQPGHWVMGLRAPLLVWWKCPLCKGQVPLEPRFDIDDDGNVTSVRHSRGNREGNPRCNWERPLKLLHYQDDA
jgi:hypothetical protein